MSKILLNSLPLIIKTIGLIPVLYKMYMKAKEDDEITLDEMLNMAEVILRKFHSNVKLERK